VGAGAFDEHCSNCYDNCKMLETRVKANLSSRRRPERFGTALRASLRNQTVAAKSPRPTRKPRKKSTAETRHELARMIAPRRDAVGPAAASRPRDSASGRGGFAHNCFACSKIRSRVKVMIFDPGWVVLCEPEVERRPNAVTVPPTPDRGFDTLTSNPPSFLCEKPHRDVGAGYSPSSTSDGGSNSDLLGQSDNNLTLDYHLITGPHPPPLMISVLPASDIDDDGMAAGVAEAAQNRQETSGPPPHPRGFDRVPDPLRRIERQCRTRSWRRGRRLCRQRGCGSRRCTPPRGRSVRGTQGYARRRPRRLTPGPNRGPLPSGRSGPFRGRSAGAPSRRRRRRAAGRSLVADIDGTDPYRGLGRG